jgi:hypothetical protein
MERIRLKNTFAIALISCGMTAAFCQADQLIDIGQYFLMGTIKNGSRDNPGFIVDTTTGNTYPGLALDDPIDITRITSKMDTRTWPILERGRLNHIQMSMDKKTAALYKKYYGKHVVVGCTIDFIGSAYTPVICFVDSIAPKSSHQKLPKSNE